jgi:hypothetical protein
MNLDPRNGTQHPIDTRIPYLELIVESLNQSINQIDLMVCQGYLDLMFHNALKQEEKKLALAYILHFLAWL